MSKVNVITDLVDNRFTVMLIDNITLDVLFSNTFIVYSNFDKNGLINDTFFMFRNKLKKNKIKYYKNNGLE